MLFILFELTHTAACELQTLIKPSVFSSVSSKISLPQISLESCDIILRLYGLPPVCKMFPSTLIYHRRLVSALNTT